MKNPTPANPTMTDTLLFEHFATLATAPEGIARLRELILQLAVQGKLGTQDARDEPASVLLARIRKEKEQYVRDGKIKKGRSLEPIKNDEIPFDLPKGWDWTKLDSVSHFVNGFAFSSADFLSQGVGVIRIGDIQNERILKDGMVFVDNKNLESLDNCFQVGHDDLVIAMSGATTGKLGFNKTDEIFLLNQRVGKIEFILIDKIFGYYYLSTKIKENLAISSGSAIPNLSTMQITNLLFPLPPLAEQHRIVQKVDRLMALCDELEARQQQERAGCLKLGNGSLKGLQNAESPEEFGRQWARVCDAFDLILDCPENVAMLRQTILQLAVLGQMDTHDPKDEPVEKIIERIRKAKERLVKDGKIKPEKKLESENETEKPFAIPKTWKWMKLSAISAFVTDGDHYPPQRVLKGIPHLTAKNVRDKKLNLIGCTFISHEDFEKVKMRYEPREDDVIITCVGTIGQTAIVPPNFVFSADRNLAAIRLIDDTFLPKFLQMILNASYWQYKVMTGSESTAQPHLYLKDLRSFCIPLPPLSEQHRIVAKVDALMALCDALESRLKERAGVQGKMAGAVVKQVAGG
ncbi:MAG: restriction endonuclease subunit S [Methanoregula sp.]|nr:restriction endonuclease subunit S [Methanoregula sp.]